VRVVVVGASGNVGTSLLRALADEPAVDSVLGLCRRLPDARFPKTDWRRADVVHTRLRPLFQGADAVVHLAWVIQPGRDKQTLRAVNVDGSARVFRAAAAAQVGTLVYASSVGAYAPGPKDHRVDESWPTTGIPSSFYARHKAEVERLLDAFEREQERIRVVRLRPGLIFKRDAASGIRRLFAGPFNIAAEPVLDPAALGRILGARPVRVPGRVLRGAAAATFKLRLQPSEPGWVDMGLAVPLMDVTRAREELGWQPQHSAADALVDLLEGMREGAGLDTPPLEPGGAGPLRARAFLSGV